MQSNLRARVGPSLRVSLAPHCPTFGRHARVAELADAHGSGPCARKGVGVQVPPRAHFTPSAESGLTALIWCLSGQFLQTRRGGLHGFVDDVASQM